MPRFSLWQNTSKATGPCSTIYYIFFVEQRAYIIEIMSRGMGTALFLIALSSREEKTVKVTVGWTLMGTEVQK